MRSVELFPCAGGMAEGFRRAGITFDLAFDFSVDACDSYESNLRHRPIHMDVRDLLRMIRAGASIGPVDLLVADPPCTPWSRAGKRQGLEDEADMLAETCELIGLVRPTAWLIGNVPGLDDSQNEDAIDRTMGVLCREHGYELDYGRFDCANYGVPQHRVRPFWFGRPKGSTPIRWPEPTHAAPGQLGLPGLALAPWVTCRDALSHLPLAELGRPVRVRWHRDTDHKMADPDAPAPTATKNTHGDGALLSFKKACNGKDHGSREDQPARTVGTSILSDGNILKVGRSRNPDPLSHHDQPAKTIRAKSGDQTSTVLLAASTPDGRNNHPPSTPDEPSRTVTASDGGGAQKGHVLTWPWDVPATTVTKDERLPPPGHHPESGSVLSVPNAVVLSERARASLQGFPEGWHFAGKTKASRSAQIGMAMPPPMAEAVARSIVAWFSAFNAQGERVA
jgi:site-specific DNA-cytosine methylase